MKEPTLGNPQNTIAVLQKYNFVFQKKFGQNFLIDTHVLDKIIGRRRLKGRLCAGDRTGNRNDDAVSGMRCEESDRGGDR